MLLIDGVKYEVWAPPSEEEFELIVKEHAEDIFGQQSEYFEKRKLRSKSGIGSIPDGYVIVFAGSPEWHVVEVELSSHPLHDHIVSQVSRFINGIKNSSTQREITDAIYEEIDRDDLIKLKVRKAVQPVDSHKFLSDLISKPPVLTIIIEKRTEELNEALSALAHPQIKVVEFQTFTREGIGLGAHAHLFEPLYLVTTSKKATIVSEGSKSSLDITGNVLEVIVRNPSCIKFHLFPISKPSRHFFPGFKVPFKLVTDIGEIETYVISALGSPPYGDPDAGTYIQAKLAEWYRRHPEIKVGDRVIFEVIEPMKRYRLRKVEEEK